MFDYKSSEPMCNVAQISMSSKLKKYNECRIGDVICCACAALKFWGKNIIADNCLPLAHLLQGLNTSAPHEYCAIGLKISLSELAKKN